MYDPVVLSMYSQCCAAITTIHSKSLKCVVALFIWLRPYSWEVMAQHVLKPKTVPFSVPSSGVPRFPFQKCLFHLFYPPWRAVAVLGVITLVDPGFN